MANKKYKLTDGNMWATDGIHDFGQNKTQRTINSEVNSALGGKAPTDHASTSTTYGKGTSSNYGHVKISDSLTDTTPAATGGVVPSMKAVSDLNDAINPLKAIYQKATWVIGSLSTADGTESAATNQIRSDFIRCDTGTRISCDSGYQFIVCRYDIDTAAYIGSSGSWQSTEYVLTGRNWIRIIGRKVDQSTITDTSEVAEYIFIGDYEIHNNVVFGANSNGNYIKFGNGILIQYGTKLPQVAMTNTWGSALFFGTAPDFTFPLSFIDTPAVQITVENGQSAILMGCAPSATGISSIQFCRATESTGAVIYAWLAFGRWK